MLDNEPKPKASSVQKENMISSKELPVAYYYIYY